MTRAPLGARRFFRCARHSARAVAAGVRCTLALLALLPVLAVPRLARAQSTGTQPPATGKRGATSPADSARADSARRIERVLVTAIRGADAAPIARTTLSRATIARRHFGQEVPLLLQGAAPSLTAYAETGTNWGYSYIRLRGIDQSRINLTIDGIPLNDAEDQVLYFADFPDLFSSVQSVQVQRGVGTSSAGTASFAGSVNFETLPIATSAHGGTAEAQYGSNNARRVMLSYGTGLLSNRLAASVRLSAQQTDGYRHHSGVMGRSALVSAGYFGDRDIVKLTATAGLMRDTLSYLAVPVSELEVDRRSNPLQPNELDSFGEQLGALSYTRLVSGNTSVNATAYRLSASGGYDVAISPDLYNFVLDFATYGVTSAVHHERDGLRLDAGVNASRYARDHEAAIHPALSTLLYSNTGHKDEASSFSKVSYRRGRATWFGDLQVRRAHFRYEPDAAAGIGALEKSWVFANPKAGVTVFVSPTTRVFASWGMTSREPTRSDMLAGADNIDKTNAIQVMDLSRVKPERVGDLEAGAGWSGNGFNIEANVYSMDFRQEIAPIGALSLTGSPLRRNVGASYRRGVEFDGSWHSASRVTIGANATLSRNRIKTYTDSSGDTPQTYTNVSPLLTPEFLSTQRVEVKATSRLDVSLEGRFQSRAFLTNTGNHTLMLPSSYVLDGTLRARAGRYAIAVRGANLANSLRYSSGYAYGDEPAYFVLPPRSVFVTVSAGF